MFAHLAGYFQSVPSVLPLFTPTLLRLGKRTWPRKISLSAGHGSPVAAAPHSRVLRNATKELQQCPTNGKVALEVIQPRPGSANFLSEFLIRSGRNFCRTAQKGGGVGSVGSEGRNGHRYSCLSNLKSPVSCALL